MLVLRILDQKMKSTGFSNYRRRWYAEENCSENFTCVLTICMCSLVVLGVKYTNVNLRHLFLTIEMARGMLTVILSSSCEFIALITYTEPELDALCFPTLSRQCPCVQGINLKPPTPERAQRRWW